MRFLLALLSPSLCVACGGDARWSPPLCRDCRTEMTPLGADASPSDESGAIAGVFAYDGPSGALPSDGHAADAGVFAYDGPAGALVRGLKFDGRIAIADSMAAYLLANARAELLRGAVVPVPVHPDHRRRRGVDHAGELGRALSARAALPFHPCLERVGDPLPQVGRGRRERMRGPVGAIRLRPGAQVPSAALLVDDVVTTGATLAACVRVLTHAGCGEIAAIAFARTTAR